METIKERSFVLGLHAVKDKDGYLQLFSKNLGYFSVYVYRIKSLKSQYHKLNQPFSLCELVLMKKGQSYKLMDADVIQTFSLIQEDFIRLTCGYQIAAVLKDVSIDEAIVEELYLLLGHTFYALNLKEVDPILVLILFQLRVLFLSGYDPMYQEGVKQLSPAATLALQHAISAPIPRLYQVSLSDSAKDQLLHKSRVWIMRSLDKDYDKLDYLTRLESWAQDNGLKS